MADMDSALPVGGNYEATPVTYVDGDNGVGFLTDVNGRQIVNVNGSVTVTATDLDIRDLTSVSDSVEVLQATHDNLNGNVTLQIADVDVSATVPVPVSATEAANTALNPIYVSVTTDAVSSTEVQDYDTVAAVVKDATSNHDYTVTATTFLLKQAFGGASGAQKIEVQTGPVAGLVSVAVQFTSSANPNWNISFAVPVEVPVASTGTVRIIRTNRDNQAQDVYSTIVGNDV